MLYKEIQVGIVEQRITPLLSHKTFYGTSERSQKFFGFCK